MSWLSAMWSITVLVLSFVAYRTYSAVREAYHARLLGCAPVTKYPHTRFLGLDLRHDRTEAFLAGRLNRLYVEQHQKYGSTWEESSYGDRIINTTETANFQTVAALRFNDYCKHEYRQKVQRPASGSGIFQNNGQAWRRSRDMIMPVFRRAELSDIQSFKVFVDRMISMIPHDGTTVDLQPLCQKLFLDNSSEFIFGRSLDSLRDTSGKTDEFLDAFNRTVQGMGQRANYFNGRLNFTFMFDKTWEGNFSKVHAFIDRSVARAREEAKTNPNTESSADDRSSRYVLINDMSKAIPDPVQLRFELFNIFLPAREPNAVAVSNTLFFLARHPTVWKELRAQAYTLRETPLTFETLQGLSSFRYALFEAIRLQGPATRLQRTAIRDTVLPRGGGPDGSQPVFVPKGVTVALNMFPHYHDPQIWGEDVDRYRPSRFEGRTLGWDFTPFFGGPRICPASQQVISQCVYLLVRLAMEFEVLENRDDCYEFVESPTVFAESRNGVKVGLWPGRDSPIPEVP